MISSKHKTVKKRSKDLKKPKTPKKENKVSYKKLTKYNFGRIVTSMNVDNNIIVFGNNMESLPMIPDKSVNLIYLDPPFNTGKTQKLVSIKNAHTDQQTVVSSMSYKDQFDDFIEGFLRPRLEQCFRILKDDGSLFLHLDYREIHYAKILLDQIFGRESFINEIIWSYDFGARQKNKWPTKHDTILWYAKDPKKYTFRRDDIDRIPYMAPGLVGPEKAARGKTPTDVWWQTIVPTNGKERTGYPTQKPIAILKRIVKVHSNPGDIVMDPFAGSGTTGVAAAELGRKFILLDQNPESIKIIKKRLYENYSYRRIDIRKGELVEIENFKPIIDSIKKDKNST